MLSLLALSVAFASTNASSAKKDAPASAAVDGLLQTSWMEDEAGYGAGESFTLKLSKTTDIKTISIWPGNLSNGSRSFRQYARPKLIRVLVDGEEVRDPIRLLDKPQRLDVNIGKTGRTIQIVVDEVFEGVVYTEMAIAEVAINFTDQEENKRLEKWRDSKEGTRQHDKFVEQMNEYYQKCKEAEFGDKDSFAAIGDAASDGAPYLRHKVLAYVPEGYRIQALPPDETAQKALRKLKNPNAIPFLERAALRSYGKKQAIIQSDVEYFQAYSDLIGGPSRNVKFWGEKGWGKGAIQSFGEPIPIEINRFGELYLADTGNNRIQLYNEEGRVTRMWGNKEPGITNQWFVKGKPWYVSGADTGKKAGQFINPVDITLIPHKEGDGFATLDANGRVQVFDMEGRPLISWTATPSYYPEPRLGGTAYLTYLPKREIICTILQDEGICFNLDAEELSRWEIPDGTPNAVEVIKNDKILMAFGDKVVRYAHDGFRDRVIMDKELLGLGYESLDMTIDEKGKLWLLTDRGDIFKFKRPGKVDYKLLAIERPIKYPRIAVMEEMLYISTDERIEVIDLRQRKLDLEQAENEQ